MPEDLIEDGMVEIKSHFKHSWWRILLILLAVIASIVTLALSLLAGSGSKGRDRFYNFNILCSISWI
jgi:hypothetical protein